mmetsp:Transcript_56480/g.151076  ORF Transcript_56480/g.151076 Transcript_56480/m.151076 type:complete len:130 (+) Transcript_56480:720-1109(+)
MEQRVIDQHVTCGGATSLEVRVMSPAPSHLWHGTPRPAASPSLRTRGVSLDPRKRPVQQESVGAVITYIVVRLRDVLADVSDVAGRTGPSPRRGDLVSLHISCARLLSSRQTSFTHNIFGLAWLATVAH